MFMLFFCSSSSSDESEDKLEEEDPEEKFNTNLPGPISLGSEEEFSVSEDETELQVEINSNLCLLFFGKAQGGIASDEEQDVIDIRSIISFMFCIVAAIKNEHFTFKL